MIMRTSPSIFVSTACLPGGEHILSRLSQYLENGLCDVELGARVLVDQDALAKLSEMKGRFLIHNYFPPPADPFVLNLASADASIRQRSLDFVSNALVLSARLSAPFYSVHAGFITDPTAFGTTSFIFPMPTTRDESRFAMRRFIESLGVVAKHVQQLGVQLLIENQPCSQELRGKILLQTAAEFKELFQNLPSQNLGILLDTGHLNVSAHTLGLDRIAFVDQVAPYIRAFHVHDNDGMVDIHQPVQAGSWVLDILRRPEFAQLPLVVEAKFKNVNELRDHVNWLKAELGYA